MVAIDAPQARPPSGAWTFDEVVNHYQGFVFRICVSKLRDEHAANDSVQNTFVSAWRYIQAEGWPQTPLQPWLACIAVRKCLDELRKRPRRGPSLEELLLWSPEPSSVQREVDDFLVWGELLDDLESALERLPVDLRLALMLHSVEGLGYREIARLTSVPVGTVKSRIHRARRGLRAILGPLE